MHQPPADLTIPLLCSILAHVECNSWKLCLMAVSKDWHAAMKTPGVHQPCDPILFAGQPCLEKAILAAMSSISLVNQIQ